MGGKQKKRHKRENYKLHFTSTPHFPKPFSTLLIFVSHLQSFEAFLDFALSYRVRVRRRASQCLASKCEKLGKLLDLHSA